jgi:hypothetical protein
MAHSITLQQFEAIDGLHAQIVRMGDINDLVAAGSAQEVRRYIGLSNRLLDACIDAIGYDAASAYPSAECCAAELICRALTSATFVVDGEAA